MKRFLALLLVLMICLPLLGCGGITKEEAIGTWSGSYMYEGNQFGRTFVLEGNGLYSEVTYKNGKLHDTESGTYEIKDGKVYLHEDGNMGKATVYHYKNGKLINNDHEFAKE